MRYHSDGYYTSELLDEAGVFHGFGTKIMDLTVIARNFFIPRTKQVHGTDIRFFEKVDGDALYTGDVWLTDRPGIVCYIRTADCLPVLICDTRKKVVGSIHAGWRGISGHIVRKSLLYLFERGSRPEDILVAVGPRIRRDCYNVGEELIDSFKNNGWSGQELFSQKNGQIHFSLSRAVTMELKECRVRENHIDSIQLCTYCHPEKFYSHRRDPKEEGRQINFITPRFPPQPAPVSSV